MSALLHALVALKPSVQCCVPGEDDSDEESLSVTSQPFQWKLPRKRKATAMQVSSAGFQKHQYGRAKKYNVQNLETFDPRPADMRNTVADRVPELLNIVKGKGLCVSLLLDPSVCVQTPEQSVLTKEGLLKKVEELKKKLRVSDEDIHQIEQSTRDQSRSPKWFEARRLHLTASMFAR